VFSRFLSGLGLWHLLYSVHLRKVASFDFGSCSSKMSALIRVGESVRPRSHRMYVGPRFSFAVSTSLRPSFAFVGSLVSFPENLFSLNLLSYCIEVSGSHAPRLSPHPLVQQHDDLHSAQISQSNPVQKFCFSVLASREHSFVPSLKSQLRVRWVAHDRLVGFFCCVAGRSGRFLR
jgi:hypothetical protein